MPPNVHIKTIITAFQKQHFAESTLKENLHKFHFQSVLWTLTDKQTFNNVHLNVYLTYKGLLPCICNLKAQLSPSKNDFLLRVGKKNSEKCSQQFFWLFPTPSWLTWKTVWSVSTPFWFCSIYCPDELLRFCQKTKLANYKRSTQIPQYTDLGAGGEAQ